ncbi:MAG: nucleotidyltransferase domain-containing protein [Dehalococcoidia bacterium]|nr:nucleotidyltransferase domain-containing protein [Dehalococcoidia bacterium]MDW8119100.1 nucleotidyltransferase domain-containing protein [Chloroflexota bacterium]
MRVWAHRVAQQRSDVLRIGYFGSYARGDWGVGSDLDVVVVVESTTIPPERRAAEWDTTSLPVPADVVVLTREEWDALQGRGGRFAQTLAQETVWVYQRGVW